MYEIHFYKDKNGKEPVKEYTQAIIQAKENYADLKERGGDAIGGNVLEFMEGILTPEEIAESELRVSIIGELIKARRWQLCRWKR